MVVWESWRASAAVAVLKGRDPTEGLNSYTVTSLQQFAAAEFLGLELGAR